MSIIAIIGAPAVGKSSLLKLVTRELGTPELIEPQKLFRCTKYNDILCLGQYNSAEFSGTDSWSYSVLGKGVFESFIAEQVKNYRHIIFEGDRLASKCEWLTENYDTKVFILNISLEEEKKRQDARGNLQNKTWISGRKTQAINFQNNFYMREYLSVRNNDTPEDAQNIKTEILNLLT
jgi:hypothetical protein